MQLQLRQEIHLDSINVANILLRRGNISAKNTVSCFVEERFIVYRCWYLKVIKVKILFIFVCRAHQSYSVDNKNRTICFILGFIVVAT